MTQIDEQIDNILLEHIVLATDNGQPYIKSTDTAVEAIKALISDQVAKARIDERSQAQQYLHGLTITPESQHLFDVLSRDNHNRIATLKGVKNK